MFTRGKAAIKKHLPLVTNALRDVRRSFRLHKRDRRYRSLQVGPRDTQCIVFESFSGRQYSGSPRAVYEAILADPQFADWSFVWAIRTDDSELKDIPALQDPRTTLIRFHSEDYLRALKKAKFWVSNAIVLQNALPERDQVLIQTWHGTPLKRLGADIIPDTQTATAGHRGIVRRYRRAGEQLTYLLSNCDFTTEKFASAFAMTAGEAARKILPLGNPRNDHLVTADPALASRIRADLGIPEDKKVILYAPTWRDDQVTDKAYSYDVHADLDYLQKYLANDYVMIFRAHYLVANQIDFAAYEGFVIDASEYQEVNELALASDLLITDYSSIFFDYLLLDRPMIFYMYDLEHYRDKLRGFYFDITGLPGQIVRTERELVDSIRTASDRAASEGGLRRAANARFNTYEDGHASDRVVGIITGTATH